MTSSRSPRRVNIRTQTRTGAAPSTAVTDVDQALLHVEGLTVEFDTPNGILRAVDDVSFEIAQGEVLGVVGESGSGKSVTAQSILRLLASPPARIVKGRIEYAGRDLLKIGGRDLRRIRGGEIGLVAQEPIAALNPLLTIGKQITETLRAHSPRMSSNVARTRAIELMESVQIPNAAERMDQYPHQFSGGMAQRVAIAIAISNNPRLLIADEPTTALDVTVQAQVMRTLRQAQQATNSGLMLITHDLALIAEVADRLVVMYAGRVVESGRVDEVFKQPHHPYTAGLLSSIPSLDSRVGRLTPIPGQPPNLYHLGRGCAFEPRCGLCAERPLCKSSRPDLQQTVGDRFSACHFVDEMAASSRTAMG